MKKEARRLEKARDKRRKRKEKLGAEIPEFFRGDKILWKGITFTVTKVTKKSLHLSPKPGSRFRFVK